MDYTPVLYAIFVVLVLFATWVILFLRDILHELEKLNGKANRVDNK